MALTKTAINKNHSTSEKYNGIAHVLVHELVHLLERHHNDHFAELMNKFMPLWRLYRKELNRSALEHKVWGY